ncbi:MAG: SDR family oxidoreductase, partial [Dehalococcoidales bacterium]|nr:SDR family oxidoreductase [Dehalococcoidales bacterium]
MLQFEGKLALVTGGSRGMGRTTSLELAKRGADVVVNFRKNQKAADEVVQLVKAAGRKAISIQADLAYPEQVIHLFDEVSSKYGYLDIFISNAVAGYIRPAMDTTPKMWQQAMDVNALAFLIGCQQAVPLMKGRKGKIVSMSGNGAHFAGDPNYTSVGASKAALECVVRYLGVLLAPLGINVNAISPGPVDTEALLWFPNYKEKIEKANKNTPLGRIAKPEDMSKVVAMLCSDDADWIVGQTIVCDGGS